MGVLPYVERSHPLGRPVFNDGLRRGGDVRIVERGVETRPSMPGGPECHLLVGVARVGNEVVIGADNCVHVNEVFWECRPAGAGVSHGPHSADKRTHRATTSFASGASNGHLFRALPW